MDTLSCIVECDKCIIINERLQNGAANRLGGSLLREGDKHVWILTLIFCRSPFILGENLNDGSCSIAIINQGKPPALLGVYLD